MLGVSNNLKQITPSLAGSAWSQEVNPLIVKHQNVTGRNHTVRKARKSCCFSKDWSVNW